MTDTSVGLCEFCRELKPVAYTDTVGREFCGDCQSTVNAYSVPAMLAYLLLTLPFAVGDKVECRTAGALYDGVGTIDNISMDPADWGTVVYPSFHVTIEDKAYPEAPDELWYPEASLTRAK